MISFGVAMKNYEQGGMIHQSELFTKNLSLRLFNTTLMLERAISAAAHIGVIWKSTPKARGSPAASGMHTIL